MAVGVVVLLVAGCSTSEKKTLTSAALSKAMPTAQDVGASFTRDRAAERESDVDASVTKVALEALETAAKSCEAVPFSDGSTKGTIAFTLKPSTGVGDRADALELVLEVSEPLSLTIHGHGIFAKRGDVGMCVVSKGSTARTTSRRSTEHRSTRWHEPSIRRSRTHRAERLALGLPTAQRASSCFI